MRQAIQTKYLGPTNFRGSRVRATCAAGSYIWNWAFDWSVEENHQHAAAMLAMKLDWTKRIVNLPGGCLKDGTYVFLTDGLKQ